MHLQDPASSTVFSRCARPVFFSNPLLFSFSCCCSVSQTLVVSLLLLILAVWSHSEVVQFLFCTCCLSLHHIWHGHFRILTLPILFRFFCISLMHTLSFYIPANIYQRTFFSICWKSFSLLISILVHIQFPKPRSTNCCVVNLPFDFHMHMSSP